jgi:NADPH:quinone reductase-like Zn-dependent oxidoreductase
MCVKAVVFETFGDEQVLRYRDVKRPDPGVGEVLVKVARVGVNRLDLMARMGQVGQIALPHICGSEVAGVVAETGPSVSMAIGTRVVVAPYLFCGQCEPCLSGHENVCVKSDIVGLHSAGGYADYVVVPARSLVPIPDGVSDSAAAAVTLSTITAWHMLIEQVRVKPGDVVLVWAAGSGVGTAAVQIAQLQGAEVIATAGSDSKLGRAQEELGARWGINYTRQDVVQEVRAITNKRGVDVVFEHLGTETMATSLKCLARGGTVVTCGTLTGTRADVDLWSLFAKELRLVGSYGGTRQDLARVLKLVADAKLKPIIDCEMALAEAGAAQARMAQRAQFGKILLAP